MNFSPKSPEIVRIGHCRVLGFLTGESGVLIEVPGFLIGVLCFLNGLPGFLNWGSQFPERGATFLSCKMNFSCKITLGALRKDNLSNVDTLKIRLAFQDEIQHSEDILSRRLCLSTQIILKKKNSKI